jgi:phospholipid/cholesterol/gamma-HCH transport system substrate-binding protein
MTTKRRDELLVGLLLLAAVVLGLGGTIWIARGGLARTYPLYARFPWGAGLKPGQPVLLAGVQVGYVDHVELIPDGTIAVTLEMQQAHQVPSGSTATVQANGIFGDMLIAITPVRGSSTYVPAGDTIPVGVGSPGTAELLAKGDAIASDVQALTGETRAQLVEGGGMKDVRATVAQLSRLVAQLASISTEQSRQLTATQAQLRKTLAGADSAKVDAVVGNLEAATKELATLSKELQATNAQVQGALTKATSGPGTVGRFMNDPAVYARVDTMLLRVDSLLLDFKKNPRRYINLSIF